EVGDPILRDDVVDVVAGGGDSRARGKHGHDAADGSTLRGGREGNDRLAAFRPAGAAHEIHLPTDAAVEASAEAVGADLPGQVDLQRRVDRDHLVVLRYDEGIVDVFCRMHLDDRV